MIGTNSEYISTPNGSLIRYNSDGTYETIRTGFCQKCGYTGEIQIATDGDGKLIWECPNCKNHDQATMNVARRTCGYIGTQYWNQGRTQEIKERVLHL